MDQARPPFPHKSTTYSEQQDRNDIARPEGHSRSQAFTAAPPSVPAAWHVPDVARHSCAATLAPRPPIVDQARQSRFSTQGMKLKAKMGIYLRKSVYCGSV